MKVQSSEFGVSGVIPAKVLNLYTPGFLCIFLLILWRKSCQRFMVFWAIFHKIMKLQLFEWLNFVLTKVISSLQINVHNILIVVHM